LKVDTTRSDGVAELARQNGATAIFVAIDGSVAGVMAIADPVKAIGAGRVEEAARRRPAHRHAHRRQCDDG
jgi:cation transport ATPase